MARKRASCAEIKNFDEATFARKRGTFERDPKRRGAGTKRPRGEAALVPYDDIIRAPEIHAAIASIRLKGDCVGVTVRDLNPDCSNNVANSSDVRSLPPLFTPSMSMSVRGPNPGSPIAPITWSITITRPPGESDFAQLSARRRAHRNDGRWRCSRSPSRLLIPSFSPP